MAHFILNNKAVRELHVKLKSLIITHLHESFLNAPPEYEEQARNFHLNRDLYPDIAGRTESEIIEYHISYFSECDDSVIPWNFKDEKNIDIEYFRDLDMDKIMNDVISSSDMKIKFDRINLVWGSDNPADMTITFIYDLYINSGVCSQMRIINYFNPVGEAAFYERSKLTSHINGCYILDKVIKKHIMEEQYILKEKININEKPNKTKQNRL